MNIYAFLLLVFAAEIAFGEIERKLHSGYGPRADVEERGGNIHLTFKIKI